MMLTKIYIIDDRSNANIIESNLFGTIEVLSKIATNSRSPPNELVQMVDMIKMKLAKSGPTEQLHSGTKQAREFDDSHGLLEKTEVLLRDWVNIYHRWRRQAPTLCGLWSKTCRSSLMCHSVACCSNPFLTVWLC